MEDTPPPDVPADNEWFAAPTRNESAAVVAAGCEPATGPHRITGDMAAAFEDGRRQGFEAGYAAGFRDGEAKGNADGKKRGVDDAIAALIAAWRDRFGPGDHNYRGAVSAMRAKLRKS